MRVAIFLVLCSEFCANTNQQEPQERDKQARIITSRNEEYHVESGIGKYQYEFETSNGISRHESGEVINPNSENSLLKVSGHYRYQTPDGEEHEVFYVADDKGYRLVNSLQDDNFENRAPLPTYVIKSMTGEQQNNTNKR